jgi:hypothetical protein
VYQSRYNNNAPLGIEYIHKEHALNIKGVYSLGEDITIDEHAMVVLYGCAKEFITTYLLTRPADEGFE